MISAKIANCSDFQKVTLTAELHWNFRGSKIDCRMLLLSIRQVKLWFYKLPAARLAAVRTNIDIAQNIAKNSKKLKLLIKPT